MNGEIQEIIEGLKVVKAFTHEEQAKADFRALNTAYRDGRSEGEFLLYYDHGPSPAT